MYISGDPIYSTLAWYGILLIHEKPERRAGLIKAQPPIFHLVASCKGSLMTHLYKMIEIVAFSCVSLYKHLIYLQDYYKNYQYMKLWIMKILKFGRIIICGIFIHLYFHDCGIESLNIYGIIWFMRLRMFKRACSLFCKKDS